MGLYSRFIFPHLLDRILSGANFHEIRHRLLAHVEGKTLEIGFGTGLNLNHYPASVKQLTAIDVNPGMNRIALRRIAGSQINVQSSILNGLSIPFEDSTFDCVVSTWTLCSIPDVRLALQEIYRVLKPRGHFYFAEHGQSPDSVVRIWQDRLTPIQKVIGDGCHLNRPIAELIRSLGFNIKDLENFYMDNVPRIGGYLYFGSATKPS